MVKISSVTGPSSCCTRATSIAVAALAFASLAGCNDGYTSPGAGADLRAFGLESGTETWTTVETPPAERALPCASFPATIAVVRVQGSNFRSGYDRAYGRGSYSIVATRDVETDQGIEQFARHPMIRAIVPLNHLAAPAAAGDSSGAGLRRGAMSLGADMLLIYTLDSATAVDHHLPELSALTLGLLPEGEARSTCTASAILLDARSGYVYALAEGTSLQKRIASAWSSDTGREKARRSAEQKAFDELLINLKQRWDEVTQRHATTPPANPAT